MKKNMCSRKKICVTHVLFSLVVIELWIADSTLGAAVPVGAAPAGDLQRLPPRFSA